MNPSVKVGTQETAEAIARALEATGNYRILRRLVPRTAEPRSATDRIGLIIDLETTSLDTTRNEVLEIAAVKPYWNNRPWRHKLNQMASSKPGSTFRYPRRTQTYDTNVIKPVW